MLERKYLHAIKQVVQKIETSQLCNVKAGVQAIASSVVG